MAEHELKIYPSHFGAVRLGVKTFEVRQADRDYQLGDVLVLREFDPDPHRRFRESEWTGYTGEQIRARVTYIYIIGQYILSPPLAVMAIRLEPQP